MVPLWLQLPSMLTKEKKISKAEAKVIFHRFGLFPTWRLNLESDLHVVNHVLQDLGTIVSLIFLSPSVT